MRRTTLITLGLILLTSVGIGAVMGRTSGGGAIVSSDEPWGTGRGVTPAATATAFPPSPPASLTPAMPGAIGGWPAGVDGGAGLLVAIGGAGAGRDAGSSAAARGASR